MLIITVGDKGWQYLLGAFFVLGPLPSSQFSYKIDIYLHLYTRKLHSD